MNYSFLRRLAPFLGLLMVAGRCASLYSDDFEALFDTLRQSDQEFSRAPQQSNVDFHRALQNNFSNFASTFLSFFSKKPKHTEYVGAHVYSYSVKAFDDTYKCLLNSDDTSAALCFDVIQGAKVVMSAPTIKINYIAKNAHVIIKDHPRDRGTVKKIELGTIEEGAVVEIHVGFNNCEISGTNLERIKIHPTSWTYYAKWGATVLGATLLLAMLTK